jgi:hypothetical protein
MKKLLLATPVTLLTLTSYGQSYNNLQNYTLINHLIGCSRQTANTQLTKAGYKLMTYQEVCQVEGADFPKRFYNIKAHYRYSSESKAPCYVELSFDPNHGNKAESVKWNEFMKPGRGKVIDTVLEQYSLIQYDKIEGPKATLFFYKNDLRQLIITGFAGNPLIKFQIATNSGNQPEQ